MRIFLFVMISLVGLSTYRVVENGVVGEQHKKRGEVCVSWRDENPLLDMFRTWRVEYHKPRHDVFPYLGESIDWCPEEEFPKFPFPTVHGLMQ